jgi:hypothetical protein
MEITFEKNFERKFPDLWKRTTLVSMWGSGRISDATDAPGGETKGKKRRQTI